MTREEALKEVGEFKPFKITVPELRRYWEDESTGVLIKRGKIHEVTQRQFRSTDLKFALMRNHVLITEGKATFVFKNQIVRVEPGDNKNLVTVIDGYEAQPQKKKADGKRVMEIFKKLENQDKEEEDKDGKKI